MREGYLKKTFVTIAAVGILIFIAYPRIGCGCLPNEALVAAEKSGIDAVRSALQAIRAEAIANEGREFNVTILDDRGAFYYVTYPAQRGEGENQLSVTGYPNALSVDFWSEGGATGDKATPISPRFNGARTDAQKGATTLAIVLEPDARYSFETRSDPSGYVNQYEGDTTVSGGAISFIKGLSTLGSNDSLSELCVGKAWRYNSVTGDLNIVGKCFE
ncbi:MAG: hypothetical protein LBQ52_05905 [Helicobacteraceae bacterium]|jgi:hypothetical protein|nr:hypothetical protein [Helicobacteraceae bacterium]